MHRILALVLLTFLLSLPAIAVQGGGGPPQPWQKTCTYLDVGNQGCDVTITMRLDPNGPCDAGCPEHCVKIVVSCPAGIPQGDAQETCPEETCELCCGNTTAISILCDGQCFKVTPNDNGGWGEVAGDCSAATASATAPPCS